MKNTILNFLEEHRPKRFDIRMLSEALNLTSSEDYKTLAKTINALESEARIIPDHKNRYQLIEVTRYARGVIDIKQKGFGFVDLDDSDANDVYIPEQGIADAMHKDRVLIEVRRGKKGFLKEGHVVRVLSRNRVSLIGTIVKRGKEFHIISDDKRMNQDIVVKDTKGAKVHDKVRAKITSYGYQGRMEVIVTDVIGPMNAPGVDVFSKILKHGIDPVFPEWVLEAANQLDKTIDVDATRRDLRDRLMCTIDGETAKDFDDAVDLQKTDEGYRLGVHIADVSHYVQENSILDKEALKRSTSIYLVDRVIPMLPEVLSNNLCSLMPKVDRYAITCDLTLDEKGNIKALDLYPSVIRSDERMTYTDVNKILAGDETLRSHYKALTPMFEQMETLASILLEARTKKGSIHFESDEAKIELDKDGRAVAVHKITRGVSEQMIEEFMLIANRAIAEHIRWMELPFIYRVHDTPKEEKLEALLTMADALGFKVGKQRAMSHKALQQLLKKVDDTASEKGINLVMLRSMQKAVYSHHNIGHFGLAFDYYTHFTSPIRRYPDLLVHRLLRTYLFESKPTKKIVDHYEQRVPEIADITSEKERSAIDLERDVNDMKKAEAMLKHIGQTFEGVISSVTNFGIYVTLDNTVEGLIHISELGDDYYHFNEDLLTLTGEDTKNVYKIGDALTIKVENVNVFEGEIDFSLTEKT